MAARPNHEQRAARAWNVLTERARSRETITYSELGDAIGIHRRAVGWALYPIQDYCRDLHPPLTSIVVSVMGRIPSRGFSEWKGEELDALHARVFDFDWRSLPNPFGYALEGESTESLAQRLRDDPASSESVYRLVEDRGRAQAIFRLALLEAYEGSCAFCGTTFEEVLDAAHIWPWARASSEQRLDVRNGVLLCSNHHRLFDAGVLTLTESYAIHYSGCWDAGELDEADRALSVDLHGEQMHLPENRELWPDRRLIRLRNSDE